MTSFSVEQHCCQQFDLDQNNIDTMFSCLYWMRLSLWSGFGQQSGGSRKWARAVLSCMWSSGRCCCLCTLYWQCRSWRRQFGLIPRPSQLRQLSLVRLRGQPCTIRPAPALWLWWFRPPSQATLMPLLELAKSCQFQCLGLVGSHQVCHLLLAGGCQRVSQAPWSHFSTP